MSLGDKVIPLKAFVMPSTVPSIMQEMPRKNSLKRSRRRLIDGLKGHEIRWRTKSDGGWSTARFVTSSLSSRAITLSQHLHHVSAWSMHTSRAMSVLDAPLNTSPQQVSCSRRRPVASDWLGNINRLSMVGSSDTTNPLQLQSRSSPVSAPTKLA